MDKYKATIKKYDMDDGGDHKIFYGFSTSVNSDSIFLIKFR